LLLKSPVRVFMIPLLCVASLRVAGIFIVALPLVFS
jgi:hypothetical protein